MTGGPAPRESGEWLEADGLGGFASGTMGLLRTRRYHALLLSATRPPVARMVLVSGFDATLCHGGVERPLSAQRYRGGVVHPAGERHLERFELDPWPRWTFLLPGGASVVQELVVPHGCAAVALSWRLSPADHSASTSPAEAASVLTVRPFLAGRDHHALHRENAAFRFAADVTGDRVRWSPYDGVPAIVARSSGVYRHAPDWYRRFVYAEETARGLDDEEDLASPGTFTFALDGAEAILLFGSGDALGAARFAAASPAAWLAEVRARELARRRRFSSVRHQAADAYLVARGGGLTIIAGYPWFTDWGRDTFIALRGLCIATGRLDDAGAILREWAGRVSQGMLPNRFADDGEPPEYNAVDASLWFVVAVHDYLAARGARSREPSERSDGGERDRLLAAVGAIIEGYARGTRFGIAPDDDGLLRAGAPGTQLTWMDAKIGDWVVTPRIGKPVEVQALWLCALWIAGRLLPSDVRWPRLLERGRASFGARFWNERRGCLYDVVDCDHRPGAVDASLRPNQLFAVGGLPLALLEGERARSVVDRVAAALWTPRGVRTLAPGEPGYAPRYDGDLRARDAAYHNGTAWPWLTGALVEGYLRSRGHTPEAKREARQRFVEPLLSQARASGHLPEIADGDAPHLPRGCPFQAWSLGELLRIEALLR